MKFSEVAIDTIDKVKSAAVIGATEAGLAKIAALISQYPHMESSAAAAVLNLTTELEALAAKGDGLGIKNRLAQLMIELRAQAAGPAHYVPTPSRPSVFDSGADLDSSRKYPGFRGGRP